MDVSESRSKIFINPNFKKAHFNRNFLPKTTTTTEAAAPTANTTLNASLSFPAVTPKNIHFNPAFLEKLQRDRIRQEQLQSESTLHEMTLVAPAAATVVQLNPIIKHTKRKLVRASSTVPVSIACQGTPLLAPLVKISKNKLVRSAVATSSPAVHSPVRARITEKCSKPLSGSNQLYKIDRRTSISRSIVKPKSSIRRYSLIRTNSISPQKVVVTDRRLLKLRRAKYPVKTSIGKKPPNVSFTSQNKKLVMVNINGVLYRSSTNKLQVSSARSPIKSMVTKSSPNVAESKQRCLTIRGTRFLLDPSGTKLRKAPSIVDSEANEATLRRIDIGRLTYMPKMDGTFVRTDVHRTRNYLSLAKQKSIQVLTNKMRKCNVSCQIYRRLGKCTAFLRGRCPKLHDPKHITICSKFLKGECSNVNCLLSHNVSLEKMPVCRFFLEGRCVRNDCPYLHKKVSEKERVCEDFLKGFCPLADKCQRRHEFICPEYDRFGVCERTKCPYPHGRRDDKRKQKQAQEKSLDNTQHVSAVESIVRQGSSTPNRRYFLESPDKSKETDSEQLSGVQKAQLRRLLGKVEQMKQGHIEEGSSSIIDSSSGAIEDHELIEKEEAMKIESDSDECDEYDENESRPPITKRAKLGPLPSFIPI